jgi:hypothetical protein
MCDKYGCLRDPASTDQSSGKVTTTYSDPDTKLSTKKITLKNEKYHENQQTDRRGDPDHQNW